MASGKATSEAPDVYLPQLPNGPDRTIQHHPDRPGPRSLTARPRVLRQRPRPALALRRASARRTCPHLLRATCSPVRRARATSRVPLSACTPPASVTRLPVGFMRYWRPLKLFIGLVKRSQPRVIAAEPSGRWWRPTVRRNSRAGSGVEVESRGTGLMTGGPFNGLRGAPCAARRLRAHWP